MFKIQSCRVSRFFVVLFYCVPHNFKAKFYRALGYYYTNRDRVPEGMQSLEKALTLATSAGDINEQARILNMLAAAKWPVAEYAAGHILASKAQKLAELSANFHEEANALWIESGFCLQLGEYKHTLLLLKRAQERLKLGGMSGGHLASGILNTEADTYMLKSEYAEARSINIKISQNTSPEQDMFRHAFALLNLGAIDVILGLTGYDVKHNLESAKMLLNSIGYVAGVLYCEMRQASLKLEEGDLPTAKTMFQKCLKWSRDKDAQISAHCLGQMADVVRWRVTDFHWTTTYTVVYLAFAQKSKQKHDLHNALRCLGDVFLLEGDNRTAENLFIVALEGYTYMDVHCSRADCLVRLGDIMQKRGDLAGAKSVWMEARPLFERSLQAKGVGQVDSRLAALKQDHVETIF
jgi:tetratricopeptide (TPR) repeat protein